MTAETLTAASPASSGSSDNLAKATVSSDPGTEYVILKLGGKDVWDRVNVVTARTSDQAIRDVVAKLAKDDQGGTFIAIPARAFKPITVTPQTVTTLKLEEAK